MSVSGEELLIARGEAEEIAVDEAELPAVGIFSESESPC